jgi:serine O-acetyltransferase
MITSKEIYNQYLISDAIALGMNKSSFLFMIKDLLFPNLIWSFQKTLRKLEYFYNCKNKGLNKFYFYYLKYRFKKKSLKLGFSIPINVFGPGLSIVHYGTIVINSNVKVGKNCRIHACTNIGASGGEQEAPQIGNNVYIGPGAKIYGNIIIADNIAIGANAVVNKTFSDQNIAIAGVPAKIIGSIKINKIIKHI